MATLTVRNLSEEAHRALRIRAAGHGRSTEAEVRSILEETVRPPQRLKLGSEIHRIAHEAAGADYVGYFDEIDFSLPRTIVRGADLK